MYCLCVIPLLIFSVQCESAHKTWQVPTSINNVGKFRRDILRRIDSQGGLGGEVGKIGESLLINRALGDFEQHRDSETKPLGFSKIIDKPIVSVNPSRSEQVHSGFGKIIKDYFNKIGWRSPPDPPALVSQSSNLASLKVDPSYNGAQRDKFKYANIDFKNRLDSNLARFSEAGRNYSDGPFQLPESLKVNSQIKDLISQSLFARPVQAGSSKSLKSSSLTINPDNIGISEGVNNPSSNSISLKILLNKNMSDILSLSKPNLPPRSHSLSITGSRNADIKPFQIISQGEKIGDKFDDSQMDKLFEKPNEAIDEKKHDINSMSLLKNKKNGPTVVAEEDTIKSARRLFDVIQSQNPLDLLNIPLLMNSFKIDPSGLSGKASSTKLGNNPVGPAVYHNEPLEMELPGSTTQKCLSPEELFKNENEKLNSVPFSKKAFDMTASRPLTLCSARNNSMENNYLPWGLPSVLTQSLPNMPIVLIPLNKISFGSVLTGPQKDNIDYHSNSSDMNKTYVPLPLAEEMHKVFNYQDILSKNFNDFKLKNLIDFGSTIQRSEQQKTGETLNLLSIPTFKKIDETGFKKRVEDFLKLSRLNVTDFHRKIDVAEKNETSPAEEFVQIKDFTQVSNASRFTQQSKKSKLQDRDQSIFPLLKVTANMALSKYSNIPNIQIKKPSFDKKVLNDNNGINLNTTSHQPEAVRTPMNWTLAPLANVIHKNSSTSPNKDVYLITEINSEISTEAIMRLNEVDGPIIENSSTGVGLTEFPIILSAGADMKNESDSNPSTAEPLSSVMQSVANNFILQTIKEYEQTMKSDPKSLDDEVLLQSNSSHETNHSNFQSMGNEPVISEDNSDSIARSMLSGVEHPVLMINESSYSDNSTYLDGKKPAILDSKSDDLDPSYLDDLSPKHTSKDEELSSVKVKDSSAGTEVAITADNSSSKGNSSDTLLQNEIPPGDNNKNNLIAKSDMKSNLVQVKGLLSATLNGETYGGINTSKNPIFQSFANSANQFFPLEISEVNENAPILSFESLEHTTPEVTVSNLAHKKEGDENDESDTLILEKAGYYISNKTRKNLEGFAPRKDLKADAFQIPAVLIEILNRMESTVVNSPGSSGYNMVFVPVSKNKSDENIHLDEFSNAQDDSMTPGSDKNDSEISLDKLLQPITLTTENPAYTKADNIYHIVTVNNELVKSAERKMVFSTPLPNNDGSDPSTHREDFEKNEPTIEEGFIQKTFSPLHNNRPIILVAIDPLKAWESQGSSDHSFIGQHMPLGIIIKSTSVIGRPELNDTIMKTGNTLIGETPQVCEEYKCTTSCPIEPVKCKEVTLFPIYPMYPVYPLKPIISSNDSSTLKAKMS